jgi:hypothetical protein
MPAAFAIHICEEWFGGFPGYVLATPRGSINNAAFMAILIGLCI